MKAGKACSAFEAWKASTVFESYAILCQCIAIYGLCLWFMANYNSCIETWRASNGAKQLEFGELSALQKVNYVFDLFLGYFLDISGLI